VLALALASPLVLPLPAPATEAATQTAQVQYHSDEIDGVEIAYPEAGAHPYKRDLEDLEFHILDTGHFALDEDGPLIAARMRAFRDRIDR
jgi:hypothetical protein